MNRRTLLARLAALPLAAPALAQIAPAAPHPLSGPWEAWKAAHLDASGRVVDALQGRVSHSEGQGYGLTLAERMGDREAFDAMLGWTERNLAVRPDALLAWRWMPDQPVPVEDTNNASDGDLFFAWALLRAADTFGRPDLRDRAAAVTADLEAQCVVDFPGHAGAFLFLPGAYGFEAGEGYVINPSYYMTRAMEELGQAFGAGRLATAAANGDVLLAEVARHGPVPDWIQVSPEGLSRSQDFSVNSGYEALRVPLWMIWSRKPEHPAVSGRLALWDGQDAAPVVVDYDTGEVLERSPEAGYRAIAALSRCIAQNEAGSAMPPFDARQNYYPATLHLFSFLAQIEVSPECFPL